MVNFKIIIYTLLTENISSLGVIEISYCQLVTFTNFSVININAQSLQFLIISVMNFICNNCNSSNITTASKYISNSFYSSIIYNNSLFSHFYPQFFHLSFSIFIIENTIFRDSYDNYDIFQVGAIMLEQNNSFFIVNSSFISLKNNAYGPVFIFILKKKSCF